MNRFNTVELNEICDKLIKLFNLKDKYHTKEQIKDLALWLDNERRYTVKQILAGIDRLREEEVICLDNFRIDASIKSLIKISQPVEVQAMSEKDAEITWNKNDELKKKWGKEWYKHWND